ncbi:hypothetical protein J1N35_018839 [Gossypium stocksii]|uniref:RNase H type-1 domain-containing protein n=1 Tax=Gossypium stocksii TaxID=47602 RepID=A0A9D4A5B5_9ROSI|nr:hypothetical protein J1N35_018839 [Gossypium stocksii]
MLWRVSWNFLPTMVNLCVKRLTQSNMCSRCKAVQRESKDYLEWLTWIFTRCTELQRRVFVCKIWVLWLDRNRNLHKGKSYSGTEATNFAKHYICELDGLAKRKIITVGEKEKWKSPDDPTIKINFDASFNCMSFTSASAIVARNANGEVIISKFYLHTAVGMAFDAKAIACFEFKLTGIEMGFTDVIVEGDSKSIINKCMTRSIDKSQIRTHIKNIQKEKERFQSLVFHFVPRSANQLAHNIARTSLKQKKMVYLMGEVPSYTKQQ